LRCLIIDDDTSVLELAESAALEANFQVRAESTARNIDAVEISSFDLILLDLMMPEVDGIEFLRIIETAKPMPEILLMSGLGTRALASARQLGLTKGLRVTEIIKKPFKRAELVEVLRRFSASYRARRQCPATHEGRPAECLTKKRDPHSHAASNLDQNWRLGGNRGAGKVAASSTWPALSQCVYQHRGKGGYGSSVY
jgi:DNA-binding response OmpR family regulator